MWVKCALCARQTGPNEIQKYTHTYTQTTNSISINPKTEHVHCYAWLKIVRGGLWIRRCAKSVYTFTSYNYWIIHVIPYVSVRGIRSPENGKIGICSPFHSLLWFDIRLNSESISTWRFTFCELTAGIADKASSTWARASVAYGEISILYPVCGAYRTSYHISGSSFGSFTYKHTHKVNRGVLTVAFIYPSRSWINKNIGS